MLYVASTECAAAAAAVLIAISRLLLPPLLYRCVTRDQDPIAHVRPPAPPSREGVLQRVPL